MTTAPYSVELRLRRGQLQDEQVAPARFDVDLFDRERSGVQASGVANLCFGDEKVPGLDISSREFLEGFHQDIPGAPHDGLHFGQFLLSRLFQEASLEALWEDIQRRRREESRPLRMELLLPPDDVDRVSDIPFELLVADKSFLFQTHGASLVRAVRDLPPRTFVLAQDHSLMVAWADPGGANRIGMALLERHEKAAESEGKRLGLRLKEPCREASRQSLEERLQEERPTEVVSLIAHGDPEGGLRAAARPEAPGFSGRSRRARERGRAGEVLPLHVLLSPPSISISSTLDQSCCWNHSFGIPSAASIRSGVRSPITSWMTCEPVA